jgi:hypothetical protein
VIDTAHGHSAGVVKSIQRNPAMLPDLPIIAATE